MLATKCDRCGRYVDTGDCPKVMVYNDKSSPTPTLNKELCYGCYNDLVEDWFVNYSEEEVENGENN